MLVVGVTLGDWAGRRFACEIRRSARPNRCGSAACGGCIAGRSAAPWLACSRMGAQPVQNWVRDATVSGARGGLLSSHVMPVAVAQASRGTHDATVIEPAREAFGVALLDYLEGRHLPEIHPRRQRRLERTGHGSGGFFPGLGVLGLAGTATPPSDPVRSGAGPGSRRRANSCVVPGAAAASHGRGCPARSLEVRRRPGAADVRVGAATIGRGTDPGPSPAVAREPRPRRLAGRQSPQQAPCRAGRRPVSKSDQCCPLAPLGAKAGWKIVA
jgi:hypothetical protein